MDQSGGGRGGVSGGHCGGGVNYSSTLDGSGDGETSTTDHHIHHNNSSTNNNSSSSSCTNSNNTSSSGSVGGNNSCAPPQESTEECVIQHPARRPMNAFLLFCKKHRKQVREKYPHLENRQVTKILGEWWADLGANEKAGYQELARQLKEAFLRANPDFKWYKIPSQPPRPPPARPSNQKVPRHQPHPTTHSAITFGKLADENLMGRLSTLLSPAPCNGNISQSSDGSLLSPSSYDAFPPSSLDSKQHLHTTIKTDAYSVPTSQHLKTFISHSADLYGRSPPPQVPRYGPVSSIYGTYEAAAGHGVKYEHEEGAPLTLNLTNATVIPVTPNTVTPNDGCPIALTAAPFHAPPRPYLLNNNRTSSYPQVITDISSKNAVAYLPVTVTLASPSLLEPHQIKQEPHVVKQESDNIQQRYQARHQNLSNSVTITSVKQEQNPQQQLATNNTPSVSIFASYSPAATSYSLVTRPEQGNCNNGATTVYTTSLDNIYRNNTNNNYLSHYSGGRENIPYSTTSSYDNSGHCVYDASNLLIAPNSVGVSNNSGNVSSSVNNLDCNIENINNNNISSNSIVVVSNGSCADSKVPATTVLRVPSFAAVVGNYNNSRQSLRDEDSSSNYGSKAISDKEDIALNALSSFASSSFVISSGDNNSTKEINSTARTSRSPAISKSGDIIGKANTVCAVTENKQLYSDNFVSYSNKDSSTDGNFTTGQSIISSSSKATNNNILTSCNSLASVTVQNKPPVIIPSITQNSSVESNTNSFGVGQIPSSTNIYCTLGGGTIPVCVNDQSASVATALCSATGSTIVDARQNIGASSPILKTVVTDVIYNNYSHQQEGTAVTNSSNGRSCGVSSVAVPAVSGPTQATLVTSSTPTTTLVVASSASAAAATVPPTISPISATTTTTTSNMTPPKPPKKRYIHETMLRPPPSPPPPPNNNTITNNNNNTESEVKATKHTHWKKPAALMLAVQVPNADVTASTVVSTNNSSNHHHLQQQLHTTDAANSAVAYTSPSPAVNIHTLHNHTTSSNVPLAPTSQGNLSQPLMQHSYVLHNSLSNPSVNHLPSSPVNHMPQSPQNHLPHSPHRYIVHSPQNVVGPPRSPQSRSPAPMPQDFCTGLSACAEHQQQQQPLNLTHSPQTSPSLSPSLHCVRPTATIETTPAAVPHTSHFSVSLNQQQILKHMPVYGIQQEQSHQLDEQRLQHEFDQQQYVHEQHPDEQTNHQSPHEMVQDKHPYIRRHRNKHHRHQNIKDSLQEEQPYLHHRELSSIQSEQSDQPLNLKMVAQQQRLHQHQEVSQNHQILDNEQIPTRQILQATSVLQEQHELHQTQQQYKELENDSRQYLQAGHSSDESRPGTTKQDRLGVNNERSSDDSAEEGEPSLCQDSAREHVSADDSLQTSKAAYAKKKNQSLINVMVERMMAPDYTPPAFVGKYPDQFDIHTELINRNSDSPSQQSRQTPPMKTNSPKLNSTPQLKRQNQPKTYSQSKVQNKPSSSQSKSKGAARNQNKNQISTDALNSRGVSNEDIVVGECSSTSASASGRTAKTPSPHITPCGSPVPAVITEASKDKFSVQPTNSPAELSLAASPARPATNQNVQYQLTRGEKQFSQNKKQKSSIMTSEVTDESEKQPTSPPVSSVVCSSDTSVADLSTTTSEHVALKHTSVTATPKRIALTTLKIPSSVTVSAVSGNHVRRESVGVSSSGAGPLACVASSSQTNDLTDCSVRDETNVKANKKGEVKTTAFTKITKPANAVAAETVVQLDKSALVKSSKKNVNSGNKSTAKVRQLKQMPVVNTTNLNCMNSSSRGEAEVEGQVVNKQLPIASVQPVSTSTTLVPSNLINSFPDTVSIVTTSVLSTPLSKVYPPKPTAPSCQSSTVPSQSSSSSSLQNGPTEPSERAVSSPKAPDSKSQTKASSTNGPTNASKRPLNSSKLPMGKSQEKMIVDTIFTTLNRQTINQEKEMRDFQMFVKSERAIELGVVTGFSKASAQESKRSEDFGARELLNISQNCFVKKLGQLSEKSKLTSTPETMTEVNTRTNNNILSYNSNLGNNNDRNSIELDPRTATNIPLSVSRGNSDSIVRVDCVSNSATIIPASSTTVSRATVRSSVSVSSAAQLRSASAAGSNRQQVASDADTPRKRKNDTDRELISPKKARSGGVASAAATTEGGRSSGARGGRGGGGRASRACKGKRYQELMDEGVLQSGRRTRARNAPHSNRLEEASKDAGDERCGERHPSRSPGSPTPLRSSRRRADGLSKPFYADEDEDMTVVEPEGAVMDTSTRSPTMLVDATEKPATTTNSSIRGTVRSDNTQVFVNAFEAEVAADGDDGDDDGAGGPNEEDEEADADKEDGEELHHAKLAPEAAGNFDLDAKIDALPYLSLDDFTRRKKEHKRKTSSSSSSVTPSNSAGSSASVGSGGGASSNATAKSRENAVNDDGEAENTAGARDNSYSNVSAGSHGNSSSGGGKHSSSNLSNRQQSSAVSGSYSGSSSSSLSHHHHHHHHHHSNDASTARHNRMLVSGVVYHHHTPGAHSNTSNYNHAPSSFSSTDGSARTVNASDVAASRNLNSRVVKSSDAGVSRNHQTVDGGGEGGTTSRNNSNSGGGCESYYGHLSIGTGTSGKSRSNASDASVESPTEGAVAINTSISSGDGSFSGEEGTGDATPLTGSQRRKARKQTITRHDPHSTSNLKAAVVDPGVLSSIGLQTLADAALQHQTMKT